MRFKKILVAGAIFVLGLSVLGLEAFAGSAANSQDNGSVARRQYRNQDQNRFMDQDCDGINDRFRDHDNDGIPNGRDPDWAPPRDGSGYHNRNGRMSVLGNGIRSGLNKASFRRLGAGPGSNLCDGTGLRGRIVRRGRG